MIRQTPQEYADETGLYVAMDSNGDWFGYKSEPWKGEFNHYGQWKNERAYDVYIGENIFEWEGNWQDSLHSPQRGSFQDGNSSYYSSHVLIEEPKKERKIVDYDISRASDVREFLQDGWELYGNPFIDAGGCIMQVIIKRK